MKMRSKGSLKTPQMVWIERLELYMIESRDPDRIGVVMGGL